MYSLLVTRRIGAVLDEAYWLRARVDPAAIHRPAAGGPDVGLSSRDDIYFDHGVSGARASQPQHDRALDALVQGDTLVITTLDRLGRSTQNMLSFADELRNRGAGLRVLNLGGGSVDAATPIGSMVFTVMAALAQMDHETKHERVTDSINQGKRSGKSLGGRPRRVTDSQLRSALRLVKGGEPAAQVARDLGMSRATFYRRSQELVDGQEIWGR